MKIIEQMSAHLSSLIQPPSQNWRYLHHFNSLLSATIEIARLISFSFMWFVSHLFQSDFQRKSIAVYSSTAFLWFSVCVFCIVYAALDKVPIISIFDKQIQKKMKQKQQQSHGKEQTRTVKNADHRWFVRRDAIMKWEASDKKKSYDFHAQSS